MEKAVEGEMEEAVEEPVEEEVEEEVEHWILVASERGDTNLRLI